MNRKRFSVLVMVLALGVTGLAATQAGAVAGLNFRAKTETVPSGAFDQGATATCRGGSTLISGGITGDRGALSRAIGGTYPPSTGRNGYWNGYLSNYSTGDIRVTTTAMCARSSFAGGIRSVRNASSGAAPISQETIFAECPSGSRVLGGGGAIANIGDPTNIISSVPADGSDANRKADDGWLIIGDNYNASNAAFIASDVICAPKERIRATISRPSEDGRIRAGQTKSVSVKCPHDGKAIAGGVITSAAFGESQLATTSPSGNRRSWVVKVTNFSGHRLAMKAYAVCAR